MMNKNSDKITNEEIKYFFDIEMDDDFFGRDIMSGIHDITMEKWKKLDDLYYDYCLINRKQIPIAKEFEDRFTKKLSNQILDIDYFNQRANKMMNKKNLFRKFLRLFK